MFNRQYCIINNTKIEYLLLVNIFDSIESHEREKRKKRTFFVYKAIIFIIQDGLLSRLNPVLDNFYVNVLVKAF